MWRKVAGHGLAAHAHRPAFTLALLACALTGAYFGSASGSPVVGVWGAINTPTGVAFLLAASSNAVSVLAVPFVVGPILRDWDSRTHAIILTTATTPLEYLIGRAVSGVTVLHGFAFAAMLGVAASPWMPWAAGVPSRPIHVPSLLWTTVALVTPNTLFTCGLFLLFCVLTRSMRTTFLAVIVVWALWVLSGLAGASRTGLLMDPFGSRALYQSLVAPQPQQALVTATPHLTPILMANRAVWLGISVVLFALAWAVFRRTYARDSAAEQRMGRSATARALQPGSPGWSLALANASLVFRSVPAMVSMAVCLLLLWSDLTASSDPDMIPTLPMTGQLIDAHSAAFRTGGALFAAFAAGEIAYRDRAARMEGLAWALPVSPGVVIAARAAALLVVVLAWSCAGALVLAAHAAVVGASIAWVGFATGIAMNTVPVALFALVAMGLHHAAGKWSLGYALCVGLALAHAIPEDGLPYPDLWRFADIARVQYSEVVGFGGQPRAWVVEVGYWGAVSVACTLVGLAVAARRAVSPLDDTARATLRRTTTAPFLVAVVVACVLGAHHATRALVPRQQAADARVAERARHERELSHFRRLPQPVLDRVTARMQFDATRSEVVGDGALGLRNHSGEAITEILLDLPPDAETVVDVPADIASRVFVGRHSLVLRLRRPMPVGAEMTLPFRVRVRAGSPSERGGKSSIQPEGTLVTSEEMLPCIGYDGQWDLRDNDLRRAHGLTTRAQHAPSRADEGYLGCGRGLAMLDMTLVGPRRLAAVTSGALVERDVGGRTASFRYQTSHPVPAYFALAWGAWQRQRVDLPSGEVVEVLSVARHADGATRIAHTAADALALYGRLFGPYRLGVLRVVEVSRFVPGPRSFPGMTVVPETMAFPTNDRGGWRVRPSGSRQIDLGRWIIAHEVAHQWWGLAAVPAQAPGWQFLVESVAQYSAYRYLENVDVADATSMVRHEIDDYFMRRGRLAGCEMPLGSVDGQPIVAYRKGLLAMAAVRTLAGSERVDRTLRDWYNDSGEGGIRRMTAGALIAGLVRSAPPIDRPYLMQLFLGTGVVDVAVSHVQSARQPDGQWRTRVTLTLESGATQETGTVPVEVQLTRSGDGAGGLPVRVARVRLHLAQGRHALDVVSRGAPQVVELDPGTVLPDPDRSNNRMNIRSATLGPPPDHPE